jgi:hypothetical protein
MKAHTQTVEADMNLTNKRSFRGVVKAPGAARESMTSWSVITVIIRVCTNAITFDELLSVESQAMIVETFEHTDDLSQYMEFVQK